MRSQNREQEQQKVINELCVFVQLANLKMYLRKQYGLKAIKMQSLKLIFTSNNSSDQWLFPYTTISHCKENNTYLSNNGSDWEPIIANIVTPSPFISIQSLVTYSIDESTCTMHGDVAQATYLHHSVLLPMVVKSTMDWMFQIGYNDRRLAGTKYHIQSVGNPKYYVTQQFPQHRQKNSTQLTHYINLHLPKDNYHTFQPYTRINQ